MHFISIKVSTLYGAAAAKARAAHQASGEAAAESDRGIEVFMLLGHN